MAAHILTIPCAILRRASGECQSVTFSKPPGVAIAAILATALLVSRFTIAQTQQGAQPAQNNPPAPAIIRTEVRQVLFDVVVTDGKNHPVAGLKRKDFSVTEDGAPGHTDF